MDAKSSRREAGVDWRMRELLARSRVPSIVSRLVTSAREPFVERVARPPDWMVRALRCWEEFMTNWPLAATSMAILDASESKVNLPELTCSTFSPVPPKNKTDDEVVGASK